MTDIHHRKIRSYVRREGRMTPLQRQALSQHFSCWGLEARGVWSFETIFSNTYPVTLEIGFGMGKSLLEMAQASPLDNFIGIEVHRPGVGKLLAGIAEQGLNNVRVCEADASLVLKEQVPENSLDRILMYFPDPWPKKRHNKRRLLQKAFAQCLLSRLRPGGAFYFATDWAPYAEEALACLKNTPGFHNLAEEGDFLPRPAWRPLTKFEQRGERLGHGVWDLGFKKVESEFSST